MTTNLTRVRGTKHIPYDFHDTFDLAELAKQFIGNGKYRPGEQLDSMFVRFDVNVAECDYLPTRCYVFSADESNVDISYGFTLWKVANHATHWIAEYTIEVEYA